MVLPAGLSTVLAARGRLLYDHFDRPEEAMRCLQEAVEVLEAVGLPRNADDETLESLRAELAAMQEGSPGDAP